MIGPNKRCFVRVGRGGVCACAKTPHHSASSNNYKPATFFLWTAGFRSTLRGKCLEGGLGRCLTDEMQRRFGLGGYLLFVRQIGFDTSFFHAFSSFVCFFVIFSDGHTLHMVRWQ